VLAVLLLTRIFWVARERVNRQTEMAAAR
jgi:hypothetical protein